jgi:hypothetical protein
MEVVFFLRIGCTFILVVQQIFQVLIVVTITTLYYMYFIHIGCKTMNIVCNIYTPRMYIFSPEFFNHIFMHKQDVFFLQFLHPDPCSRGGFLMHKIIDICNF